MKSNNGSRANSKTNGKSVRFEPKKSIVFFRVGSTVSLFRDNLKKQMSLKKD
jgi:hypothetical protein